ncbi:hypothetical protein [Frankia sp. CiP1_Cm_nod2]|uniref:hypothetical protein n=1 Tax=Frankia sp. CiP1_Cm_nod2 TaxID=2897161 RepID=UPI00202425FB
MPRLTCSSALARWLRRENADLERKLTAVSADLAQERATAATLRRLVVELSLELNQTHEQRLGQANVVRLASQDGPHSTSPS